MRVLSTDYCCCLQTFLGALQHAARNNLNGDSLIPKA